MRSITILQQDSAVLAILTEGEDSCLLCAVDAEVYGALPCVQEHFQALAAHVAEHLGVAEKPEEAQPANLASVLTTPLH